MTPDVPMVVIRDLLERNAVERPDEVFIKFEDGVAWTRREGLEEAYRSGNALSALGVRQGDRVAMLMPNGPEFIRVWWGASVIGATIVPINLAYRGAMLAHLLATSDPHLAVVSPEFDEPMDSCEAGRLLKRVAPRTLEGTAVSPPPLERPIEPWDSHMLVLTSGTTGPSKLAEMSYWASYGQGSYYSIAYGADDKDVLLLDLPLFHGGPLGHVVAALACRTNLAIRTAPELGRYWEVMRETGATMAMLLSTMVPYLLSRPVDERDRENSLRLMVCAPLPPDIQEFTDRFGVGEIVTGYGSTEQTIVLYRAPGEPLVEGYCGRIREGFEMRLVDEFDYEVPVGAVGEAIVRSDQPWRLMTGYFNNPEAQASVNRNGWFHTGDMLRMDEDGNYFFVDRGKDSLRRRGENVSSFEVEAVVNEFDGVAESACVAHPAAEGVDDEVKVWVVPVAGRHLDLEQLFLYCVEHMPHFMVPQYLETVEELPKTPTARPKKHLLREWGNSDATWDRSAYGYSLTRRGLSKVETV